MKAGSIPKYFSSIAVEKIDLEIFRQSGKTQQLGNSFDWGAGGRGAVGGNEP